MEALHKAGREDLIGYGPQCLLRPSKAAAPAKPAAGKRGQSTAPAHKKGKSPPARAGDRAENTDNLLRPLLASTGRGREAISGNRQSRQNAFSPLAVGRAFRPLRAATAARRIPLVQKGLTGGRGLPSVLGRDPRRAGAVRQMKLH